MSNVLQFPDSPEIANRMCFALADNLGRNLARQIVFNASLHNHDQDQIDVLMKTAVNDAKQYFTKEGADAHDTDMITKAILAAMIDEGKKLVLAWNAGGNA